MKNRFRLLVLTAIAALGLAFAGSALAAYQPQLWVQQGSYKLGAASTPGFLFTSAESDDPTAKMTIYSPSGYTHDFTSLTPGATVGSAYAVVKANALGGALLPLSGPVVVGDPNNATLKAASQQCTGSPNNQLILVLNTTLQGQTISVPDFVNVSGNYVTQQICLPPPATAQFQAQVILANWTIKGIFANPAAVGTFKWVGDFTPYAGTVPNAAGTVEDRTDVGLPSTITFKRVKTKKFNKFVGRISIHGYPTGGKRATLYYGRSSQPAPNYTHPSRAGVEGSKKAANTAPLKGSYYFIARFKVKVKTYFQMRFSGLASQLKLPCSGASPSGLPLPCLGENIAPLTSPQVAVKPAKKKHRRR
jgi:hypothetical protein